MCSYEGATIFSKLLGRQVLVYLFTHTLWSYIAKWLFINSVKKQELNSLE